MMTKVRTGGMWLAALAAIAALGLAARAGESLTMTTFAEPRESPGAINGKGGAARFSYPNEVAVDSSDNGYTADSEDGLIRGGVYGAISASFAANQAPVIDSSPWADASPINWPTNTTQVHVMAHDPDSFPQALICTWSMVSGPGTVGFSPNGTTGSCDSTATFSAPGTYDLCVTVFDGAEAVFDDVSIRVNGHAPVANAQSLTTVEDMAKGIILTATDADGDVLTFTVVANPTHGALSGTAPTLTYTPAPGYTGLDSFAFKANDGAADSNTATIVIEVKFPRCTGEGCSFGGCSLAPVPTDGGSVLGWLLPYLSLGALWLCARQRARGTRP
jgi:hypothetical protein